MVMLKVAEGSLRHHVTKVTVWPHDFYSAGMAPGQAEMAALERHPLSLADETFGHSVDGFFPCGMRGCNMEIDAEREQEAALNGCVDPSCQSNGFHGAP